MIRRIRSCVRTDREGQTLAVVAISMVALLAIMSLGIDLGMAYTARAEAQRVADSAALAGASAFLDFAEALDPAAEAAAYARAFDYAGRNVVRNRPVDVDLLTPSSSRDVTVEVLPDIGKVRVWIRRDGLPAWFARFIGQSELRVSAMAAAQAFDASSSACVKPFAIPDRWDERTPVDPANPDGDWLYDRNKNGLMDFDNAPYCTGNACNANENWRFVDGVDQYEPLLSDGSNSETATSWGSQWKTADGDLGARLLITPQEASSAPQESWWQYWQIPGLSPGTNDMKTAIAGCLNLSELGLGIGDAVEANNDIVNSIQGNRANPIWTAVKEALIDPDPNLQWDAANNVPYYPQGTPEYAAGVSPWASPRIITVALVHPRDVFAGSGSRPLEIVDFATLFLEDPRVAYPNYQQAFKLPITGRLVRYGSGAPGGENNQAGQLQKYLRLVE
jgi:hypothetical protein